MARPKGNIDLRILRAARDRFLRDGVDGASLRDIARSARTSIGMIYYYFPTKDDLFLAVTEEVYARLVADLAVALAPDVPVEARLGRLFARLAAGSDDEFTVLRLVLREALVSSTRRARILERFFRGHVPLVLTTILEGTRTGALSADHPPFVISMATFALALFPQLLRRLIPDDLPGGIHAPAPAELAEAMHRLLMHGVATG